MMRPSIKKQYLIKVHKILWKINEHFVYTIFNNASI